ncbi:MAG: GAF domain-containing protein [Mycobacteriaceae bacterium]
MDPSNTEHDPRDLAVVVQPSIGAWLERDDGGWEVVHGRLRGLLQANRLVVGDLPLPVVLRELVTAACELTGAPEGGLSLVSPDGGWGEEVHVGRDGSASEIGPRVRLLLDELAANPRPIRLREVSADPRVDPRLGGPGRAGSFLGVPVAVRGTTVGTLHLLWPDGADLSEDDEELIASLAASAGIAVENARLLEEARRKQGWLQASTEITRQLLAVDGEEPLRLIAGLLQEVAGADAVNVVLPHLGGRELRVDVATGVGSELIAGTSYPVASSASGLVLRTRRPFLVPDVAADTEHTVHLTTLVALGPVMVLPLVGAHDVRGALVVARLAGRARFTDADLDMATTFSNHAALALELADARAGRDRVVLLEDRDRIARDLHDHVVQRIFGAGLSLESVASTLRDDPRGAKLSAVVDDLDETIRQIRTSIFKLQGPIGVRTGLLRSAVLGLVAELTAALGLDPSLDFCGPLDTLVPDEVVDDVLAVIREGLTNVARHAGATRTSIALTACGGSLVVELADDGLGTGDVVRSSGLANLRQRAVNRGGELVVESPSPPDAAGGTRLCWTVPLP